MSEVDDAFGFSGDDQNTDELPSGPAVGVVRILKRDYAVGLIWNAVDQPSKAVTEARQLANSHYQDANFFCVRQSGTPQIGLGFKIQGHRSGMPSLAAHVAAAKGGNWIGLFEVPGGYYLIAVRDDGILSECDTFISEEDVARETFETYHSQSDWAESIAPNGFNIPGTTSINIEDILEGRPSVKLKDVKRGSSLVKILLGIGFITLFLFGLMFYMERVEEERLYALQEELARQASSVLSQGEEEIVIPAMPWEGKLMGTHFLQKCHEGVMKFPLNLAGWNVSQFICEGGSVTVTVNRAGPLGEGGGSINWLSKQVTTDDFKPMVNPSPEGSGQMARVAWSLGSIPYIRVDLETASISKMKKALLQVLEERFTPVRFTEADSNEFWLGFAFQFETDESPLSFLDVLSALPGVILDRIIYSVEEDVWKIEGKAYEQLPLPENNVAN